MVDLGCTFEAILPWESLEALLPAKVCDLPTFSVGGWRHPLQLLGEKIDHSSPALVGIASRTQDL
jgi:hypothetical protein